LEPVRRAYAGFEYARADVLLEAATTRALTLAPPVELPGAIAEILLWRGVVAVAQGRDAQAQRWFQGALRLRPDRVLSPTWFPPKARRAFPRARAPRPGLPRGTLRIDGHPPRLRVAPAGRARVAAAPLGTPPAGVHLLVTTRPGF